MSDMPVFAADERPVLTCIVASYNHARYLARGIEACTRIPLQSKQIIVIDDGSKDDSVAVSRDTLARIGDRCDTNLISRTNHGLVSSLNHALMQARGEFVFLIASDDLALPDGVAQLVAALQSRPAAALALGNAVAFRDDDETETTISGYCTYGPSHDHFFALPAQDRDEALFLAYPNPLLIQATVFRRDALARIGDFDETLVLDDYPLFIRLLRQHVRIGDDVLFLPKVLVSAYRQHAANSHRNLPRQMDMEAKIMDRLCPPEIKAEALARRYIHFALRSLRALRLKDGLAMISQAFRQGGSRATMALLRETRGYASRNKASVKLVTVAHPSRPHG